MAHVCGLTKYLGAILRETRLEFFSFDFVRYPWKAEHHQAIKSLHKQGKTRMWLLSKLLQPSRKSRYLLGCVDANLFQAGNLDTLLLLESKKQNLSSLVASNEHLHRLLKQQGETQQRTHLIRRHYPSSFFTGTHLWKPCNTENVVSNLLQCYYPQYVSVRCQQTSSRNELLNQVKAKEYINLYLNNKIRILRVFCTFAKVSTILFVLGVPGCAVAALNELLTINDALFTGGTLAFYAAFLTAQSYFLMSRFVCKIMISTDETYLKVSHLSMFGRRRDIYVQVSDVIPITGSVYQKAFLKIQFKNSSRKLILLPESGEEDTNFEALEALLTRGLEVMEKDKK